MEPEEDSDEEWRRIADAVGVFEAQYVAARNANAPSSAAAAAAAPAPSPQAHAAPQAPPPPLPTLAPQTRPTSREPTAQESDADPYSLALRQREAEISQLRMERQGEIANYRNKIRALQNQLHSARSGRGAAGSEAAASTSAAHAAFAPRLTQLENEKARLSRELAAAQRDVQATRERLAFAEHELVGARDRERSHLAALRERGGSRPGSSSGVPAPVAAAAGQAFLTQAGALTQAGEVVEGTQPVMTGTGRPSSSQGFSMRKTSVRAPVRRRRRVSSAGGSAGGSASAARSAPGGDGGAAAESVRERPANERKRSSESAGIRDNDNQQPVPAHGLVHGEQHGWGVRLSEATWEHSALRQRIFGCGLGDQLLEIATTLKQKELRQAIMCAMAHDSGWAGLLDPVAALQEAGRAATMVSTECLGHLLTFSDDCRHKVGRGETTVLQRTKQSLTRATQDRDSAVAARCMRVLVGGACGIGEVASAGGAATREEVRCDAALDWIRGTEDEEEQDEARRAAVALAEAVTGLALEDDEDEEDEDAAGQADEESDGGGAAGARAAEWMFVERAYLAVCSAVTSGEADDETLHHACAMLVRAGLRAPYVVHECGGAEAAAHALICATRFGDGAAGVVSACAQALCAAARGGGKADAGLAVHTRNALLGVVARVGAGEGVVAAECRRVGAMLTAVAGRDGVG